MAKKQKQETQVREVGEADFSQDLSVRTCGHLCQGAFDPPFSMKLCDPCGGWGCACALCAQRAEGAGA